MKGDKIISRQIFELRYKAVAKVLDLRGALVDDLSKECSFEHWKVSRNRIELKLSEDDTEKGFVSYYNCGYVIYNASTKNYFSDKAIKFTKALLNNINFTADYFLRFGVRSTFCREVKSEFKDLVEKFAQKTNIKNTELLKIYKGKLVDIGFPLNFEEGDKSYNTMCGPMDKEQMPQFIIEPGTVIEKIDFPELALFFDIDIFRKEIGKIKTKDDILNLISSYSKESWKYFEHVYNHFLG
ncbi:MAG: hypothetical protein FJZ16_00090 [Candidatus Omnitrophica bacterium]|nr:hypothetical protein [Candidatus Omnitrophota bacterium]